MKTRISRTFKIEMPDGTQRELEATVDRTVNHNYGSDADGRRGIKETTYEDAEISEKEWAAFKTAMERALENCDWED